ncbi:related to ATP-dependent RNA helicase MRH4, mitochondrial [Saccharomycodes ludwigii]|uniref:RNA helicase n=1 Tax=Saccharomycodes ludwigii TaxID=36035 RepID=A0A376B495_9ASCO|nr:hypothetical protein SCDLUD_001110 [Saccharomycodes ludwigii]KAH3903470.1 hypothetical protein SCDLUD_001110 [Saccharomycodes ludwigii]SSD59508.1 related to ATP-dependent RNA helicase MRH4, mitochondrial [Saccharomycodes ludwigii]
MLHQRTPRIIQFARYIQTRGKKTVLPSAKELKQSISAKKINKKKNIENKEPSSFHYGKYGRLCDSSNKPKVLDKITSFRELKILPEIRNSIIEMIQKDSIVDLPHSEINPSPIQVEAIFQIMKKIDNLNQLNVFTIAAETGSGKTMAYLIPLLNYLRANMLENEKNKSAIRSVILLPTHELVNQVYQTLTTLSSDLGLNVSKWDATVSYNQLIENIKTRIDILVTIPSKINDTLYSIQKINRPEHLLNKVEFAVIDEADTLMDKSFKETTIKTLKKFPNLRNLIFCSATIPTEFQKTLSSMFIGNNTIITTPKLHKLPSKLKFHVVDATLNPFKGNKIKVLQQILYAISKDGSEPNVTEKRCIVFVNDKDSVKYLVDTLSSLDYKIVGLTGQDTVEERFKKIQPFLSPSVIVTGGILESSVDRLKVKSREHGFKPESEEALKVGGNELVKIPNSNIEIPKQLNAKKRPVITDKISILVCTDLMARGMNFKGVRNVILYDVPNSAIDLVHRCGRTARMRQGGRVFMITDKSTKSWAKAIPKIIKKNMSIS